MRKIIEDNVNLSSLHLTKLLDLSDVAIRGYFNCGHNNLTNLKGAPKTVEGLFSCRSNNLTSLEGIPKTVGGNFYIDEALRDKFPEESIRSLSKIRGSVLYW